MGKTIQTIATIIAGMPGVAKPTKGKGKAKAAATSASSGEGHGPTLIVCPSSAMLQWADEVQRSTPDGAVKVVAFYGPGRTKLTKADLEAADIVLTTFVAPLLYLHYAYHHSSLITHHFKNWSSFLLLHCVKLVSSTRNCTLPANSTNSYDTFRIHPPHRTIISCNYMFKGIRCWSTNTARLSTRTRCRVSTVVGSSCRAACSGTLSHVRASLWQGERCWTHVRAPKTTMIIS